MKAVNVSLLLAASLCQISSLKADDRPSSVPRDYELTPAGYFHPSCINAIRGDEKITGNGIESQLPGQALNRREISPCRHPHFRKNGEPASDDDTAYSLDIKPTFNGWAASASYVQSASSRVTKFEAKWKVPGPPNEISGQVIFLFPGLEPSVAPSDTILQPVLAWGYGGPLWTIASWNCCISGQVFHSAIVPISPNDLIKGSISGYGCDPQGICGAWIVTTTNLTTGASTILQTTSARRYDWVFGAALEPYYMDRCTQLPASGKVVFYDFFVNSKSVQSTKFNDLQIASTAPQCVTSVKPYQLNSLIINYFTQ